MVKPSSEGSVGPASRSDTLARASSHQPEIDPRLTRRVGPLTVRAEAAEVAAFRRATSGVPSEKGVPFSFPVRWFAHPMIRAAGAELGDGTPWVPIHESQSFDYERPLEIDVDYRMMIDIIREREPARLILRAEITSMENGAANCLRMEMILRIIPTPSPESPT